jgi:hypothetical protein
LCGGKKTPTRDESAFLCLLRLVVERRGYRRFEKQVPRLRLGVERQKSKNRRLLAGAVFVDEVGGGGVVGGGRRVGGGFEFG